MKKYFVLCLAFLFASGIISDLLAQDVPAATTPVPAKEENKAKQNYKGSGKLEHIETSGILKVTPADPARKQKYATIVLVCSDKEYKLLPGLERAAFAELEKMAGQTITVKGDLLPANDKYPMPAIKVNEIPGVSKADNEPVKGKPRGKGKAREKI